MKNNIIKFWSVVLFQVKSNFRTAITVPEKCWGRFRDILNEYCEKMCRTGPLPGPIAGPHTGPHAGPQPGPHLPPHHDDPQVWRTLNRSPQNPFWNQAPLRTPPRRPLKSKYQFVAVSFSWLEGGQQNFSIDYRGRIWTYFHQVTKVRSLFLYRPPPQCHIGRSRDVSIHRLL